MTFVLSAKTMIDVCNDLRERGKKTVFTHGAFDLIHIGHTEMLRESKKKGDCLIIGVESDERIAKYKGSHRPVVPLEQRLEVISSLDFVDFVVAIDAPISLLNQKYYFSLYDALNPSVVSYGRNFKFDHQYKKYQNQLGRKKQIEIAKIIHKYDELQSTSKIIDKIKSSK